MAEESGKSRFLSSWNYRYHVQFLHTHFRPALVLDAILSTQGAGSNASAHGFRAALRNEMDSWCFSHEDPEVLFFNMFPLITASNEGIILLCA